MFFFICFSFLLLFYSAARDFKSHGVRPYGSIQVFHALREFLKEQVGILLRHW